MPEIDRKARVSSELKKYVSQYITELASQQSLITVTNIMVSDDFKSASVLISVLPESDEEKAVKFIERHLHDMHKTIEKRMKTRVPFLTIAIDLGEKNRQRIDELIHESHDGINGPKA